MGNIRQNASPHFINYPNEKELIYPFLNLFFVTWAKRIKCFNTELSFFILGPEDDTKRYFGFLHEILLVYAPFEELQDRTMKAVEQMFLSEPAKGRVETFSWIIITKNPNADAWFSDYCASNGITKKIIPLYDKDVLQNKEKTDYIKNILTKHLFVMDWFDMTLPLKNEDTFFGRNDLLNKIRQGIRARQNIGLFGLRKTGKTSIIFRIEEMFSDDCITIFYDCRQPILRSKHWFEFLDTIVKDIIDALHLKSTAKKKLDSDLASLPRSDERFMAFMHQYARKKPILLVFDEFEFISSIAKLDPHWRTEFIDFWQTLQAVQNETNKISFVIAGVNPYAVENISINGEQNPLFNIFQIHYVTGFDKNDIKNMVQVLGQRMGLLFSERFCNKIYDNFGGHPLLCRLACSAVHKMVIESENSRPKEIDECFLEQPGVMEDINYRITIYCKDILTPLHDFYKDEYDLLTYLATDDMISFMEFAEDPLLIEHLKRYGIINYNNTERPYIKILALKDLIVRDYKKENHLQVAHYVVPQSQRANWLKERLKQIQSYWKRMSKLCDEKNMQMLSSSSEISNLNRYLEIKEVTSLNELENFLNTINICIVEPIKNYGIEINNKNYLWTDIKNTYKHLFHALCRINAYRNASHHQKLTSDAEILYQNYLLEDFDGRDYELITDGCFLCQQIILDSLVVAFMLEINGLDG